MFDAEVRQMNVDYLLRMRARFAAWLEEIVRRAIRRGAELDVEALADQLTVVVEGAIILSKALKDPGLMGRQTRLFRNHVKLLFGGRSTKIRSRGCDQIEPGAFSGSGTGEGWRPSRGGRTMESSDACPAYGPSRLDSPCRIFAVRKSRHSGHARQRRPAERFGAVVGDGWC